MAGDSRVFTPVMAANLYTQEGAHQEFLKLGQPRDREEDETELEIRFLLCKYWQSVLDWVSTLACHGL